LATAPRPLICDVSGKICSVAGKRLTSAVPAAVSVSSAGLPTPASSASVAAASPSPGATPQLQGPKQQSLAAVPQPLICDASGKICASASVQPQRLVSGSSSLDHAVQIRIDGAGAYDSSAGLDEDPSNWVVRAYKSQHRLEIYHKGHLYRTYHAVFGRSPVAGAKLWEGDRRTPEGDYLIVGKHLSARFGWFLHINYPNAEDQARFERSRTAHLIPASAREGGQIGIHGTDSPYLNVADIDWTTGCISVDNADIRELAYLLPVGTLVVINP
jgi:lipoprotein-anchoring transpeptidase ErfK/SrfK